VALVVIIAIVVVGIALAGGGSDDEPATTSPAPSEAPSGGTTAPTPGGLPPEFLRCMADQGFDVQSFADIHSVPRQALQACLGSLHQ
jgi:hypothetical protein